MTTTLRKSPPPRQTPPLNRKLRRPPQLTRRRKHPPVPTVSSSRKPQQPLGLHHGSETRTGGPEEYPPAPHAEQKQQQANKAGKYVYKQHNKHGNRQWRPPPQSQGGPGWGILYRPQTSDNNTTQSSSSSSHNWGQPSDSSTGSQSWGDHPPQTQPQTPQPGTKADTYARERFADLLNRHTLPRDTIPSRMQQVAGTTDTPKPKQDKNHGSTTRRQADPQQATRSTHSHTSHGQTNSHHHHLALPRILPRRGMPPIRPKQNGQPPSQISKPRRTFHRTSAFPQPQQPPPSSPRSPTAAGKSGFDPRNNQAAAVAMRPEAGTNEDYLSSMSLTLDKQDHWTEPHLSPGGRLAALRRCHRGTLGSS